MTDHSFFDRQVWKKKAMAFVTRSHRHLWGKNNEDPQAYLFTRGLKNQFIKDMLIGWNKFSQTRPARNWGKQSEYRGNCPSSEKLFFPSGIVVPFIVEKELNSIFIHSYNNSRPLESILLPGSSAPTLLLEKKAVKRKKIVVIQDLCDGLYLFQEVQKTCCVIIHPDPLLPKGDAVQSLVKTAESLFFFSANKTEDAWYRNTFPDIPNPCFFTYGSKTDLETLFLNL